MARDKTDKTDRTYVATKASKLRPLPQDPIEVFEAVEGDREGLIALLRSDEPLNSDTREALALWLEGSLPPKVGKGRPRKMRARGQWPEAKEAELSAAIEQYKWMRNGLKARGIHTVSADCLIDRIAAHPRFGVSADQLRAALRGDHVFSTVAETIPEKYLTWKKGFRGK